MPKIYALSGVIVGSFNNVKEMNGLQLGFMNTAVDGKLIQVGLLNTIQSNPRPFRNMSLINWRFKKSRKKDLEQPLYFD